jgi:hypothetical protein
MKLNRLLLSPDWKRTDALPVSYSTGTTFLFVPTTEVWRDAPNTTTCANTSGLWDENAGETYDGGRV